MLEPKAIMKSLGSKAKVYAPFILLRSLEVWKAQTQPITVPSQIRYLIEATYKERKDPVSWQELFNEWNGTDSAKKMIASRNCNIWQVALNDEEGVQTRLNEIPTIPLVLCQSISGNEAVFVDGARGQLGGDDYRLAVAQAIHKNLVRVPRHLFDRVEACPAFSTYLYGEQSVGIVTENRTVEVKGLKDGIRLSYSDMLGLAIEKTSGEEEGI